VGALQTSDVLDLSAVILREQRARLVRVAGPGWEQAVQDAESSERRTLAAAFRGTPAEQWAVPDRWSAPHAVGELAARLGVEGD
jgi:hypothetical protein